ncbi:MAG: adenylate kinase [Saccharofermentanales bacterium]
MRIILLGAPGAGKGSVGKPLSSRLGIPVISTGDIFRQNIAANTELGKLAKMYIDNGALVPDEITVSIIADRLKNDDCIAGYILDGFPRTVFQARELDRILESLDDKIDVVLNIMLSDDKIISRLSNRMVCGKCGESYNAVTKNPAAKGICDVCGGKVSVRDDDAPETVRKRLDTYNAQTQPLIEYYTSKGLLVSIDNDCTIAQGLVNAMAAIDGFMKRSQS